MNDAARLDDGFRGSEERGTTVEKVPHPRLMVQSGPGVLFAYLSTSTGSFHDHHCRYHHDSDIVSNPRPPSRASRVHFDVYFSPLRSREGGFPCFPSPLFAPCVCLLVLVVGVVKGVVEGASDARVCAVRNFSADDGAELRINFKIICLGFSRLSNRFEFRWPP